MRHKALFLDRDGLLNRMVYDKTHGIMDSPRRVEQLTVMPGARELLAEGKRSGFMRIVVTNQPGIAKGTLTWNELDALHETLSSMLSDDSCAWEACYVCPHHPEGGATDERAQYAVTCDCRKPKPGLIFRAAREWDLDLAESWILGDGIVDIQAGRAAGCRTMLVHRLKPEILEHFQDLHSMPDVWAAGLDEAVRRLKEIPE